MGKWDRGMEGGREGGGERQRERKASAYSKRPYALSILVRFTFFFHYVHFREQISM